MATKTAQPEDATDVLEPKVEDRKVTIGVDPYAFEFTQRTLNFFQKLEVFSLLGGALNKAMSGPDGITISEILEGPSGVGSTLTESNLREADTFVQAIAKLIQYAPDLLADLYMVILAVPRGQREVVKGIMESPVEEGGLSDEDGVAILETFVDQNWDVMLDFFKQRVLPLANKIGNKVQESQPSKPSKNTQQPTQKQ